MEDTKEITIFVSCPTDVESEKEIIIKVCKNLGNAFEQADRKFRFHVYDWRDIVGEYSSTTQEVIDNAFSRYDIYLGMLWKKFGTATGTSHPSTGVAFESGTQAEFQLALHKKQNENSNVKIYFLFKSMQFSGIPMREEREQWNKVLDFRESLKPGMVNDFETEDLYNKIYTLLLTHALRLENEERTEIKKNFLEGSKKSKDLHLEKFTFKNDISPLNSYIPRLIKPLTETGKKSEILFTEQQHLSSLYDVVLKNNNVVLLGNAGSGKSVELYHLVSQLESNEDAPFIPIFKRLNTYVDEDIESFLPEEWQEVPEEILLVALDGLDEIQPQHFNTAARKILSFAEKYKQAHILITSRTNFYELPSQTTNGTLPDFEVYFVEEVRMNDVKEFVTREYQSDGQAFIHEAYQEGYFDLITKPFFLNILAKKFKSAGDLKSERSEVINDFIFSRIDLDENHYNLTIPIKKKKQEIFVLLQKIALVMESLGRNFISQDEVLKILKNSDDFELVKYFTAFAKKPGQENIWMFEHNNIQEYIAAQALSQHGFETIKKFISFPPSYNKVKPSWVNTLSFLISISNKQISNQIIDWLSENDFEIIIKFEPDRVSDEMRFHLLEKIFHYYKEKNIWISSNKFNDKELSRFSQSEKSIDFLINEFSLAATDRIKLNALHLLDNYNYKDFPLQKEKLRALLFEIIDNADNEDVSFLQTVLYAIANLEFLDFKSLSRIVNKLRKRRNQYIRAGLYFAIHKSNFSNEFVDILLEGIKLENENNNEDRSGVTVAGESWGIKEGLQKVSSPKALKKVFTFLENSEDRYTIRYSEKEVFTAIIENAVKAYAIDETLFDAVLNLFKAFGKIYETNYSALFASFFEQTKTDVKAFENIWLDSEIEVHQKEILISGLVNEPIITSVIQNYLNHDYTNNDVVYLYKILLWNFGRNSNNLIPFLEAEVEEKTTITLPKQNTTDYTELYRKRRQEGFDLLFDKDALQAAANNIFDQLEKEELEDSDLWDYRKNNKGLSEESFPISAFELVREFTFGGKTVNRTIINQWFQKEKNVEYYQVEHIYNNLKNKNELQLNSAQIQFIEDWCKKIANYEVIASAVKIKENFRSFSVNRFILMLWFFIRKFKIEFPDNILLAFTLFEDFERRNADTEISEIDELEQLIEKKKIEDKVVSNLQLDITIDRIWKNNALYAIKNNLTAAFPSIIRDLKNYEKSEYYRPDVLRSFYTKTKDYKTLEEILSEIGGDALAWTIIKELINDEELQSKDFLEHYLLTRMRQENEAEENRLFAAKYLIELNNIEGLKFYSNYFLEKKDPKIEYSYLDRSFAKFSDPAAIPILLDLLKLSKQPDFQFDHFNRLDALVLDLLYNIGMANDSNLMEVTKSLTNFIEENKSVFPDLNFLYVNIDRLQHQFYMEKSKSLTIEEAIQEYQQLV